MEKTQEILKHMHDLYNDQPISIAMLEASKNRNPDRFEAWKEAFAKYDLPDIFSAIDYYWRFANNKTKPTIAKLLAVLNTQKVEKYDEKKEENTCRYFNIENKLMTADTNAGINLDCLLTDYKRAVDYILTTELPEEIGMQDYVRILPEDRYRRAVSLGLFDNFTQKMRTLKEQAKSMY